jgi:1-acyl-sn-glycerol-3-phosphate acyltransferase
MRKLFILFFKLKGWKIDANLPKGYEKCVVIAAPHTSNWDFVYSLAVFFSLKIPVRFLAKAELFKWPLKPLMLNFGGMPVQRSKSSNMVDSIVELFNQHQQLMLLIPAEGTRSKVEKWKTGFYHVALKANVPVLLGYLDYEKKMAGFGPLLYMTGNPVTDADAIKLFYKPIKGKFPELFNADALVLE